MKTKIKKISPKEQERLNAVNFLLDVIHPGDTVYTTLKHVSASGMSRSIAVIVMHECKPWNLTRMVAKACGWKVDDKHDGVRIGGCGMDMGYHLVYSLAGTLFRESGFYCTGKEGCPANDHNNERYQGTPASFTVERRHSDAGYALSHRWL